jgi:hypothetical protein
MDMGGAALRFLQGSTAFTALIAVLITFVAIFGYLSSGLGAGRQRSSGITMFLVVVIGLVAAAVFLFPHQIQALISQFRGVASR